MTISIARMIRFAYVLYCQESSLHQEDNLINNPKPNFNFKRVQIGKENVYLFYIRAFLNHTFLKGGRGITITIARMIRFAYVLYCQESTLHQEDNLINDPKPNFNFKRVQIEKEKVHMLNVCIYQYNPLKSPGQVAN